MKDKITLSRILEAVLFASDSPVETKKLMEVVEGLSATSDLLEIIEILNSQFEETGRSFRIVEVAGGFQLKNCTVRNQGRSYRGLLLKLWR